MSGKQLGAIIAVGTVCCCIVAGVATVIVSGLKGVVSCVHVVADNCCDTVQELVSTIMES